MSLTRIVAGTLVALWVMVGPGWLATGQAQTGTEQSVPGGGVTVKVRFLKEPGDGPAFLVTLDTHSVDLVAYRFEEIVRLRDGRGGELSPTAVEGAEGSGHHRSATVLFTWPEPKPACVELVVKDVAGVPERLFSWSTE